MRCRCVKYTNWQRSILSRTLFTAAMLSTVAFTGPFLWATLKSYDPSEAKYCAVSSGLGCSWFWHVGLWKEALLRGVCNLSKPGLAKIFEDFFGIGPVIMKRLRALVRFRTCKVLFCSFTESRSRISLLRLNNIPVKIMLIHGTLRACSCSTTVIHIIWRSKTC